MRDVLKRKAVTEKALIERFKTAASLESVCMDFLSIETDANHY